MKKVIVSEINQMRRMMGLQEQSVVDAVKAGLEKGLKGSDDEYKLMGYIATFMDVDSPDTSMDDKMEWIEKYRAPIGKFGKTLFDYLHGESNSYDKNYFTKLMKVFNTPDIFKSKPTDEELIEIGKNITEFKYN